MNNTVRTRVLLSLVAVACLALAGIGGGPAFAKGSHGEVICKKTGKRQVSCPKKELRGKHGKQGQAGPQGAQGPQGVAGPAGPAGAPGFGIPLIFRGQIPTQNTPIFNVSGLLINASCGPTGAKTALTGVSIVAGSILRATDVVSGASERSNSTVVNQNFDLTPGGAENNYVLTYLAGNGSSILTANYGIANGGMSLVNVSCAVFGTVQVAAG